MQHALNFYLVLLRYNWHTTLYKFKVHSIITWPTYTEKLLTASSMTIVIKIFFLVMRNFRIYSFNNFQIYYTAVLTVVIMLFLTSPVIIFLITGRLYVLTTFIHSHFKLQSISHLKKWWLKIQIFFCTFFKHDFCKVANFLS